MKNMKKNLFKFLKKYCITLWLVISALLLMVTGTFALYKYQQYAKMVARTGNIDGLQFSSNYLEQKTLTADDKILAESEYSSNIKYIYYSKADPSITFTVCNYPQNNSASYNRFDIEYKLYAKLIKLESASEDLEISGVKLNDKELEIGDNVICESKLATNNSSCNDSYTLTVPKEIASYVAVIIEARPNDGSKVATDSTMLCRKFMFTQDDENDTKWTGSFVENGDETYWGYNYTIKGTRNTTLKLTWNEDYVTLSKWCAEDLDEYNDLGIEDKIHSITFKAGGNGITSYQFQFYRVSTNTSNDKPDNDWVSVEEVTVSDGD